MNIKKFIFIMGIVIAFLLAIHPGFASDELKASDNGKFINGQEYVKNRVLVKFWEDETPAAQITETSGRRRIPGKNARHRQLATVLSHRYRSEIKGVRYHKYTGYYMFETHENCDIADLCRKLRIEPFVMDASPDYYAVIDSKISTEYESTNPTLSRSFTTSTAPGTAIYPNDEYFQYQYSLYNTGQVYLPETGLSGTSGSDIKAPAGWAWTTGSEDVIIAVIDSGVAGDHEDLLGKVIPGYNFVDDKVDAYDDHGHGTFTASIIAANTNNGVGIAGVCWQARIMPLKTMEASGYGSYSNIAAGIRWAAEHGAHVINLSVGGSNPSFILEDACKYAYEQGLVIVCSAGNYSPAVHYPAAYDDYCFAVAATGAEDQHAPFSNTGPEVDVAAPGYFVWGARFSPITPDNLSSYSWDSGTSFACPYAAGAAALLISYKPYLTNAQIMSLIRYTADDVNQDEDPGFDHFLGYGRINLRTLLEPYKLN
jgi:thermitase